MEPGANPRRRSSPLRRGQPAEVTPLPFRCIRGSVQYGDYALGDPVDPLPQSPYANTHEQPAPRGWPSSWSVYTGHGPACHMTAGRH